MAMTEIRRGRRFPFIILPHGLLDDPTLTAHDILVYATIARYADNSTGVAYPSRATIAESARCDIKTVDSAVRKLVLAGCLEKHKRSTPTGESNLYIVHEQTANTPRGRGTNGAPPRETNGARGRGTNGAGTRLIELDTPEPSEWTPMPEQVRAMLPQPDTKGAA
jgi:hypothetical protein